MTVQRLHANDAYTFAPYNAYFNDYYTPDGDGAIAGQTVQDDMFYYFPRKQAEELLEARDDDDAGVLDRLESAYAAYVRARCLDVPDGAGYGCHRQGTGCAGEGAQTQMMTSMADAHWCAAG